MSTIGELFQLQEIDSRRQVAKRRLLEIQAMLVETAEVAQARQSVEETQSNLHQWRGRQLDADLEAQSLKAKIEENDRRLMGGQIRNPKDLESLQSNGDSLRRHQALVEERAVEALLHVEELTVRLQEQEAVYARLREGWAEGQRALISEGKRLQQQHAQSQAQRVAQATRLDRAALVNYEALRKRKAGVAVAAIVDDTCGACFVRLPTGIISGARTSSHTANAAPTFCPSCGRILFAG